MKKWRNFYLQRMGKDEYGNPYPCCESVATWSIWCKDIPFAIGDKVKDPASRKWYDEYGDDEYIPEEGLKMEAYTMKVELGCKVPDGVMLSVNQSASDYVRAAIGSFLDYLKESGMMKIYSTYTKIGRQNVRLSKISDKAWYSDYENESFLIFEVELKVNDPVTNITLDTGEDE